MDSCWTMVSILFWVKKLVNLVPKPWKRDPSPCAWALKDRVVGIQWARHPLDGLILSMCPAEARPRKHRKATATALVRHHIGTSHHLQWISRFPSPKPMQYGDKKQNKQSKWIDLDVGSWNWKVWLQHGFSAIKMENESQPRHVQKVYHEALTQMSVLWAIMGLGGKSMRNPWFYHQKHVLCFFSINCLAN